MRLRVIQTVLLAAAVTAGVTAYRSAVRPREDALGGLAQAPLQDMFGPRVAFDRPVEFDLAEGVVLQNLRVPTHSGLVVPAGAPESGRPGGPEPLIGFGAAQVRIAHDPLALAAGRYRPTSIEIEKARIITHETETGIAPDFPFVLASEVQGGPIPSIVFRDAEILYRARPGSQRLRAGSVLIVHVQELSLLPDEDGTIQVKGSLGTHGLGQDEAQITLSGTVASDGASFDLVMQWDPLELTSELLALLAEELAEPLRQRSIQSGTLVLELKRRGGIAEGAIGVKIDWDSDVDIAVADLPGLDQIDASTKEQLQELFGGGALQLEFGEGRANIKSLVTEMAGGRVHATGWAMGETGEFHLDFEIRDLRLEDPAVRRALGSEGAGIYDEFDPHGVVDAVGVVTRNADGEVEWAVDVLLENASLRYVGSVGETGKREGFPYRVEEATGQVRIRPDGVTFDDIVGFNRGAEIRILGRTNNAWTGGETGRILFTDDGPDVRLTVIATNVPFDERLKEAIDGSEFADMMADFDLRGVIDKIEIDVIRIPKLERAAKTELRITLEGEEFRYTPFPLPLEDVRGQITMRRPVLGDERGRVYAFDVKGWAEGAPIQVSAEIVEHESRGRLHVSADGIPLAGGVTETVLTAPTTSEGLGPVWRWLGPRGKAQVEVDLPLSDDTGPLRLDAELQGGSIRLDAEGSPAPIEFDNLRGTLTVDGDDVQMKGVTGTLGDARVEVDGTLDGGVEGVWKLNATVQPFRITPALQSAFAHLASGGDLLPHGMSFETGSRMALALVLHKDAGVDSAPEVEFVASQIDALVRMAEGGTLALKGSALMVGGGAVRARDVSVEYEGLTVKVPEAEVTLGDDTSVSGRFELSMDDYALTEGVLTLLPDDAAELLRTWTEGRVLSSKAFRIDAPEAGPVTLTGTLSFVAPPGEPVGDGPRGTLEFAPLVLGGDGDALRLHGTLRLDSFSMDAGIGLKDLHGTIHVDRLDLGSEPGGEGRLDGVSGKVADLRVADLSASISWTDGILRVPSLTGRLDGGALSARFVMQTVEPTHYEGAATVRNFDVAMLRDDLAPTGAPYAGRGTAQVTFQNRGGTLHDLTASGSLRIRNGRLGELPFVANIFVLAGEIFSQKEPPQFERADVEFVLEKEVFRFRRFDLAGPLFDMPGKGTLDTTGVVDLRFTPDFIKGFLLPGVMQLPVIGPVLRGVLREEALYAVRVRGDLATAEPEIVPFPPINSGGGQEFEGTGARELPRRRLPRWFR